MNTVALILLIISAVLFAVAAFGTPYSGRLTNAGLCLLTVGLIIQFGAKTHGIHFG